MSKKFYLLAAMGLSLCLLAGCGNKDEETTAPASEDEGITWETVEETPEVTETVEEPEEEPEVVPEGMYRSELTNEIISKDLETQRPIAVMVDNEITALNHFGVNSADIVYEIMNSTKNDRVTRLMCIFKDYASVEKIGSIRSTRPTNFFLMGEYNAILCHDGGPFYINDYIAMDYVDNLNGGFARFSNGKNTEFTEYITYDGYTNPTTGNSYAGLKDRIAQAGYDTQYNSFYPGKHFEFNAKETDLTQDYAIPATTVQLPFKHTSSKLVYNESTKTYDYYVYNQAHVDEGDGNKITSFKNVIIQGCSFSQLDENGYLIYNVVGAGDKGYYLTNGKAIPINWYKDGSNGIQYNITYFDNIVEGGHIKLNTGKTYITIVPDDSWGDLVIK
ncbi:Protein of unknown function [Lachnospiraceae bacterium G11]|nr:Protein of unknown function [Lachnospiraceae bacterium G11]